MATRKPVPKTKLPKPAAPRPRKITAKQPKRPRARTR